MRCHVNVDCASSHKVSRFWGRGSFPVNCRLKLFLRDVQVHFDCACSQRGSVALGLRHFHCKFSQKRALAEILLASSLRGLCMILYRSSTEDLMEILVRSFLRGPCMRSLWERPYMIWYRSLWEDLVEILLKSPSRGPCIKIFQILCIGACMKALLGCSYEVLVWRSCELLYIVYIEGPAAAAAIMSNLICYCSIATVACI